MSHVLLNTDWCALSDTGDTDGLTFWGRPGPRSLPVPTEPRPARPTSRWILTPPWSRHSVQACYPSLPQLYYLFNTLSHWAYPALLMSKMIRILSRTELLLVTKYDRPGKTFTYNILFHSIVDQGAESLGSDYILETMPRD